MQIQERELRLLLANNCDSVKKVILREIEGADYVFLVETQMKTFELETQKKEIRKFKTINSAIKIAKEMGIKIICVEFIK